MKFPSIDEPTVISVNDVINRCENVRRLFEAALKTTDDEVLQMLLRRSADAHAHVVTDLQESMLGTAGAVSRGGTMKGFFRRLCETIGQRAGWRNRQELMDVVFGQLRRALAAFDAASDRISSDGLKTILAEKRAAVAELVPPLEAMAARDGTQEANLDEATNHSTTKRM